MSNKRLVGASRFSTVMTLKKPKGHFEGDCETISDVIKSAQALVDECNEKYREGDWAVLFQLMNHRELPVYWLRGSVVRKKDFERIGRYLKKLSAPKKKRNTP